MVGRIADTAQITAHLDRPAAPALLVSGPAGIGKSCLVEHAIAQRPGQSVCRLRAGPSMRTSPYEGLSMMLPEVMAGVGGDRVGVAQSVLDHWAKVPPDIVYVDDVPNADPETLVVLFHVVQQGLSSLLITARDGEPIPGQVLALAEEGMLDTVRLGPLAEADIGALLREVLGGRVDGPTVRRLYDRSAGNPLLLRELVRGSVADGSLHERAGVWRWDASATAATGIEDLALANLSSLSPEASKLFDCLALLGDCPVPVVDRIAGAAAQRELLAQQVAELDSDEDVLRVAHPLFAEVAVAQMGRIARHDRLRSLLIALRGSDLTPADQLRTVRWRLEVGDAMTPTELSAGAALALQLFDIPLSIELGQAAHDGGDDSGTLPLALALIYAGDLEGAAVALDRAVAQAESEGDRVFAAVTRTLNRGYRTGFDHSIADEHRRLEDSLADPALVGFVRSERTSALTFAGHLREAVALGEPFVRGPHVEAWEALPYLPGWGMAASILGRTDEVFEALAVLGPGALQHLGRHVAWFHFIESHSAVLHGDFSRAEAAIERFAEQAHVAMVPGVPAVLYAEKLGTIAWLRGDVVAAQRGLGEAVALSDVPESSFRRVVPLAYLAMAQALAGDAVRARATADAARASVVLLPLGRGYAAQADAWAAAAGGDLTGAHRIALAGVEQCVEAGLDSPALWCAIDAFRFNPSVGAARRIVDLAPPVDGPLATAFGGVGRAWLDKDPDAMVAVAQALASIEARPYAADAASAAASLAAALGRRSSARVAAAMSASIRSECPGLRWSAPSDLVGDPRSTDRSVLLSGLTTREREVTALAAAGGTNAAIADALGLSIRTVEGHVHRAMAKLSVTRRIELEPFGSVLADQRDR
jgi:DNA-binding CsgD family transcriptional regulator